MTCYLRNLSFNRKRLLFKFVISSFYLSMIIPFINGLVSLYAPAIAQKIFIIIAQSYIYILPLFFILFVRLNSLKAISILAFYFYLLVFTPLGEFFSFKGLLFGFKNYFLIMLYFPIIHELLDDEDFVNRLEKSINFLFVAAMAILFFEFFSMRYVNPIYVFLRSLAGKNYPIYGKPNGIDLGIHLQGYIFSIAFFYYLINKRYLLSIVALSALFICTVKTWIIAFGITLVLYVFKLKSIKKVMFFISSGIVSITGAWLMAPELFNHYIYSFGKKSRGLQIMVSQILDVEDLFLNSFLGQGLRYNLDAWNLPSYIHGSEIFAYSLIFQIGIVGFLIFILILFSGIFSKDNKYRIIIFLSLFSFLHSYSLARAYMFILFIYFSSYHLIQIRETKRELV